MKTRAKPPGVTLPHRTAALAAFALAVAGCGSAPPAESPPEDPLSAADPVEDCLVLVWQQQAEPAEQFDRKNDLVEGGAISCATGTSASQFEAALTAIRAAAASGDKASLLAELGIPLLYIDVSGNRRVLHQDELADALFDEVFSPDVLALLRRVQLEDLTVVPDQGAFVELGAVWLVVDSLGGRPRIVTVNRQALGEAAAAARRAAKEGGGRPAPLTE
jgi:predicted small lipoprotein YifL